MSFNVYLQRALRSSDPVLKGSAKVVGATTGYADRLLGVSARKMRTKVDLLSKMTGSKSHYNASFTDARFMNKLKAKSDSLTSQSNSTRIKTGLGIAGAVLANKAMSNYKAPTYDQQYY